MLKALAIKELRESAGIVVLAIIGAVYALGEMTATPVVPWQANRLYTYPFVGDQLSWYFWLLPGGLAIALGLRQTAWELGQGTYFFLLHRPLPRARVFGLKLVVGGLLVLSFSAGLILVYALWAVTPGHIDAPFEWRMTTPAWIWCLATPLLYVGAFLSGIRPARWFGTRLVPLLAAIGAAAVVADIPWLAVALCVSLIGTTIGLVSIFYYVRARDY
jgi:hypothetical protein